MAIHKYASRAFRWRRPGSNAGPVRASPRGKASAHAPTGISRYRAGVPVVIEERILEYAKDAILLVNGIGSVGDQSKRTRIFSHYKEIGYNFASVIHPQAVIASNAVIGEGNLTMPRLAMLSRLKATLSQDKWTLNGLPVT